MELFYVLSSGKYFGAVVGDFVDAKDNIYVRSGYIEVPYAPESSAWYWNFKSKEFYLPPLTGEALLAANASVLQQLMGNCLAHKTALLNRISTIQDAIDIGIVTDEEHAEKPVRETQLAAWKEYGVLLGRVAMHPNWYIDVNWPIAPSEGMDLTVAAPLI